MLALAGCETPASDASAPRAVEAAQMTQPVGVRAVSPTTDMCGAGELQWLVGKPKTDIPVPVDVVNRRVTCTTCPVTEDYSPHRLNIFFNEQTEIIEQVRCG
ncbi:I78 family peptidase inhibitor [uncultured Brevundimonas sp.]|uniref:I78 family peptidase inhibitor n=1 Tax=uncultured Brevundimonas sp. TaxID=213418 RepID=UPI0026364022|nr:I78 family peptidase inhibitor [uncultured Brevundimonas sp.]